MSPLSASVQVSGMLVLKLVGCGRFASKIGGLRDWWEVDSNIWWEVSPKTGGTEIETPATCPSSVFHGLNNVVIIFRYLDYIASKT